jgi:hypothetical protein
MRRLAALLLLLLAACGTEQAGQPDSGFSYLEPEPVGAQCPDTFDLTSETPWVPHPPTTETLDRLAPDADPVEAVVCRYTPEGQAEQSVDLTGGLDRIRHDLLLPVKLPGESRPCTLIGGRNVPHLLYLRYADGDLWVSGVQEPNSCTDTGNGEFVSSVYLGQRLAASYDQGAWVSPPQPDGCSSPDSGRLGQEQTMVPGGWESLLVCRKTEQPEPREVSADDAARIADLLNSAPAEADSSTCSGPSDAGYDLLFGYPDGPPVHLWWMRGCEPSLHNGSLQATPSAAQSDELEALLAAP